MPKRKRRRGRTQSRIERTVGASRARPDATPKPPARRRLSRRTAISAVVAGVLALVFAAVVIARSDEGEPARSGAETVRTPNRFNEQRAFDFLEWQVRLGPRPAGSRASRQLAARLKGSVPGGRYQAVPGGLRNVLGTLPGRVRGRLVVVGAHYDTKDLAGFVGANDGASGTAVVRELARTLRRGDARSTIVFAFFDGEETPRGVPDELFVQEGLRGSKVASRSLRHADAMILLDFVGDRNLSLPREAGSNAALWAKLRRAAARVGRGSTFPAVTTGEVLDDHLPFKQVGVPAIDLIDFDFPCFHKPCDNLSVVSARSLDAVGETLIELLKTL